MGMYDFPWLFTGHLAGNCKGPNSRRCLHRIPLSLGICVPGHLLELCLVGHLAACIYVGLQGMPLSVHAYPVHAYQQSFEGKLVVLPLLVGILLLGPRVVAGLVGQCFRLVSLLQSLLLYPSLFLASSPRMKCF